MKTKGIQAVALRPIQPTGQRNTVAFVNPGGLRNVIVDVYPDGAVSLGAELRHVRVVDLGLSIREAATRLGLSPSQLCDIEMGRAELLVGETAVNAAQYRATLCLGPTVFGQ